MVPRPTRISVPRNLSPMRSHLLSRVGCVGRLRADRLSSGYFEGYGFPGFVVVPVYLRALARSCDARRVEHWSCGIGCRRRLPDGIAAGTCPERSPDSRRSGDRGRYRSGRRGRHRSRRRGVGGRFESPPLAPFPWHGHRAGARLRPHRDRPTGRKPGIHADDHLVGGRFHRDLGSGRLARRPKEVSVALGLRCTALASAQRNAAQSEREQSVPVCAARYRLC